MNSVKRISTSMVAAASVACCLLFSVVPLLAAPVAEEDVVAAVETRLRSVGAYARPDAVIESMTPHVAGGRTVVYVAHLVGGGYCLCGADTLVLPIYLYCPQGEFDRTNPGVQYILREIGGRLANIEAARRQRDPQLQQYAAALARRDGDWKTLIARQPLATHAGADGRADPGYMVLDMTDNWSQSWPYNAQCPELVPGSGDHAIVGCVATAMTQIMYYWQWPPFGEGSHSHDYNYRSRDNWDSEYCPVDPGIPANWNTRLQWINSSGGLLQMVGDWDHSIYGAARRISVEPAYRSALEALYNRLTQFSTTMSANFGTTSYNWNIIQDTHADPWDSGDAEVSKLALHAGISVNMGWGVWLSLAGTGNVDDALEDYFRYDTDATFNTRNIDTMTEEIRWLRPIELCGTDPELGGHAWTVYGYDTSTDPDRLFLMDMGWGGNGNGWYSCDNVNPSGYEFNDSQGHVIQVAPESVVRFVEYGTTGGDGSPSNPYHGIDYAMYFAPEETTLILKAGSTHSLIGDPVVLDKPMVLKGYDVRIERQ